MLKLLFPLPRDVTIAFSGGVDSVAVADFLSRNHNITCAFYHHGTENSERAMEFVAKFCSERDMPMIYGMISNKSLPKGLSLEEHWRNERYKFLSTLGPVITAHHLDDCVETYIWSALHGTPKVIPFRRNNVLRPFLTTPKQKFVDWCNRKEVAWCHDKSNDETKYTRNYIRHELMPHALRVNPGLHTVVKKIIENKNEFIFQKKI